MQRSKDRLLQIQINEDSNRQMMQDWSDRLRFIDRGSTVLIRYLSVCRNSRACSMQVRPYACCIGLIFLVAAPTPERIASRVRPMGRMDTWRCQYAQLGTQDNAASDPCVQQHPKILPPGSSHSANSLAVRDCGLED